MSISASAAVALGWQIFTKAVVIGIIATMSGVRIVITAVKDRRCITKPLRLVWT
jgi:hypothetical protein